ncbi:glutamate N-acetyltransferase/amino-acid N-acetyltransferase [Candidatus Kinetoplastibacterium desouzaii TCC079E]|uniref:Arginine biosynthesis bifunctional protein ArgJ n=1 Tax=Candidatus Kinetoplastidibacterium desouzai TCC079E TaxID=1208919 RepID=M1LTI2_9PROT|nr:bifunctional glutamate N-acetyltransferase/amino-acid acetyltransferase ArgJ [Candidatus Kinetoplastibacterium desouzaii]AGF46629.1 glutamate N-acetyltransferase/amino-acid N-acetyltransferase [Candidatus Kinetoplastibacterium desouzaii TCC079E]
MAINLKVPGENEIFPINGIEIGIAEAGIKKINKKDLTIFKISENTTVSGSFTRNLFKAAPVQVSEENLNLSLPRIRALVINTGNANAGTGKTGIEAARNTCEALGKLLNINPEQILPFSTGVIMEPLPIEKLIKALPNAIRNLGNSSWQDAAYSIMTTDTTPKIFSEKFIIGNKNVTVTGISKGAGMICPNMATMLAFIGTDIKIEQSLLNRMIKEITDSSFNRITVDGDTSTNDSFVIMATGTSDLAITSENDKHYQEVLLALKKASLDLSQKIIRDAEGATKFITIDIVQANNTEEALKVAYSIAHSPLVKTAFYASDPNIGRILAAIGYSKAKIKIEDLYIWLNEVLIVKNGAINPDYKEEDGKNVLQQTEIRIKVFIGTGNINETIYTCDLSHEYVTINAEYRS